MMLELASDLLTIILGVRLHPFDQGQQLLLMDRHQGGITQSSVLLVESYSAPFHWTSASIIQIGCWTTPTLLMGTHRRLQTRCLLIFSNNGFLQSSQS